MNPLIPEWAGPDQRVGQNEAREVAMDRVDIDEHNGLAHRLFI